MSNSVCRRERVRRIRHAIMLYREHVAADRLSMHSLRNIRARVVQMFIERRDAEVV